MLNIFRWFRTARRLICKSSKDDLSLLGRPHYGSSVKLESPLIEAGDARFSTRTRLRPGGPGQNQQHSSLMGGCYTSTLKNGDFGSSIRNGSMPSMASANEELNLRSMAPTKPGGQGYPRSDQASSSSKGQFGLGSRFLDDPYQTNGTGSNKGSSMQFGSVSGSPMTPLVKQKTLGCSSPRVQVYRTRVVYSDRDPLAAAGLGINNIPEAAV